MLKYSNLCYRSIFLLCNWGFPDGSDGKEYACNVGDLGWENPLEKGIPTPIFWPGQFHGQRSLAFYSPWSCKELATTERLSLLFSLLLLCNYCIILFICLKNFILIITLNNHGFFFFKEIKRKTVFFMSSICLPFIMLLFFHSVDQKLVSLIVVAPLLHSK